MADLFSTMKEPITDNVGQEKQTNTSTGTPIKKGENHEIKNLFKVYYKGKGGKFSDKESARIVQIERDNRIFKNNWYYWKRQAERLSADYYTEHEKVLELEEKVKVLEAKLKSLTNNLSYAKKTYPQQKAIFAS